MPLMALASDSDLAPGEYGVVDFYEAEYVSDDAHLAHQVDAADLYTSDLFTPGGISDPAGPPEPSLIEPLGAPSTTPPPVTLPARRLTTAEFDAWVANYHDRGGINEFELEVLRLTNIERAAHGVPPLTLSPIISMAARFKSQEMHDLRYFSHDSPVYGFATNIPRELFGVEIQGENIGADWRTPASIVSGWMNSPGHRANVLNPNYTFIGIGFFNYYWTQMFSWHSSSNNPVPAPPLPDGVIVDSWLALSRAINAAPIGEAHTIYIASSFPAGGVLTIPAGRDITLMSTFTGPSVLNVRTLTGRVSNRRHFIVDTNSRLTLGQNIVLSADSTQINVGGIQVNVGGELIMNSGSTIDNFRSHRYMAASAVIVDGTFTMNYGSTIDNFTMASAVTVNGTFTMNDGSTISNIMRSPAIRVNGTFTMDGGLITGTDMNGLSGLVFVNGTNAEFVMNDGAIRNAIQNAVHTDINQRNAAVRIVSGTMTMNGGEITGNDRGVMVNRLTMDNVGVFTMNAGKISDNRTGVYIEGGTFIMEGGEISGNRGSAGAGISVVVGAFYMVGDDAIIRNNHSGLTANANLGGGGISLRGGTVNITAGTITENTAAWGGGVHVSPNAAQHAFTMTGGYITNNTATFDGGGIYAGWFGSDANPIPATAFLNLNIGPNAVFSGNTAGNGLSAPPDNRLPHIATTNASRWGNPLNNYDINYTGRLG